MSMHVFRKKRLGFNAIELVVVILLVFILIGLVLVFLQRPQKVRDGDQAYSINNLKILALAPINFNSLHKKLPPAYDQFKQMTFPASVHVHLMPFVEQDKLYQTIIATRGQRGTSEVVPFFLFQIDITNTKSSAGVQNFAANLRVFSDKGLKTPFDCDMAPLADIEPGTASIPKSFEKDGTSNTILFAPKFAQCGNGGSRYAASPNSPFAAFFGQNAAQVKANATAKNVTFQLMPENCHTNPLMAQTPVQEGIDVAMADGSVRFISAAVSPRTWNQLVQPNDGMKVEDDWLP
jgi:hypothetical protein